MGTNYYLKIKLSPEAKLKVIEAVINDKDKDDIINLIGDTRIHIGKQSGGWKFLFNANDFKYFGIHKEDFIKFLKSGTIINEYGDKYSYEDFTSKISTLEGADLESYYSNSENKEYHYMESKESITSYIKRFGIQPNKHGEFYLWNLRFTTCTDFS